MSEKLPPDPVKVFVAMLSSDLALMRQAALRLGEQLGPLDLVSEPCAFSHTSYYAAEMGQDLQRVFFSFEPLQNPAMLAEMKTLCAMLEESYRVAGRRRVNLDPGYLDFCKVVLGSYKYGGQKIYLKDSVYADIVLLYAKGTFNALLWTFPDFSNGAYHEFLLRLRRRYKEQFRQRETE
jgi:hypothetical protein